jgi:hypothetical protein
MKGTFTPIGRAQSALVPSRDGVEEPFIGSATTPTSFGPRVLERSDALTREEQQQPANRVADHER